MQRTMTGFVIKKDAQGYEHLAFSEVLVPNTPNTMGDFHTEQSVRDFAYGFMVRGFGLDINHEQEDLPGKIHVVESFIARAGDPDFTVGAWVVGVYIPDDAIWKQVLDGDINGFSWDATVSFLSATVEVPDTNLATGTTQPDMTDGHTHEFVALLDADGRVTSGSTSESQGHTHSLSYHTFTDTAAGHRHIYNVAK